MSLATDVEDLATAVATAIKSDRVKINGNAADLSALATTAKTDLVSAINEVAGSVGGAAGIDDGVTSTSSTWSSSKTSSELAGKAATNHGHAIADTSGLQAALDGKAASSHGHAVAEVTGLQTALDGKAATSHTHTTAQVTGLDTALAGKAAASHTHAVGDVSGFTAAVDARVQLVVDAAPAALDTLNELAAAIGDDANFAATVNTALTNRVRVDAAQALSGPQQAQARANIGAVAAADIGNTATDYVAVFEAALV